MKYPLTFLHLLLIFLQPVIGRAQASVWTWMHGSRDLSEHGTYGSPGVADPANMPRSRYGAFTWTDKDGKFWMYGGIFTTEATAPAGTLDDLCYYDPQVDQWTWVNGSSSIGAQRATGARGVPAPGNTPGARYDGASWIDTAGNFWLYGGSFFYQAPPPSGSATWTVVSRLYSDLWRYTPSTNLWTWMGGDTTSVYPFPHSSFGAKGQPDTASKPGLVSFPTFWTGDDGQFWLLGGTKRRTPDSIDYLPVLWKYDPGDGRWAWMSGDSVLRQSYGTRGVFSPDNIPRNRSRALTWTDPAGRLWMYGGNDYNKNVPPFSPALADLWQYDPTIDQWAWMNGDSLMLLPARYNTGNDHPGARSGSGTWIDAAGHLMLFAGGHLWGYKGDVWQYDIAEDRWTWIDGDSSTYAMPFFGPKGMAHPDFDPGARSSCASWSNADGHFWIFGGTAFRTSTATDGTANDVWRYAPEVLSTGNIPLPDDIRVMPNPFKDGFSIAWKGVTAGTVQLELCDLKGVPVYRNETQLSGNKLEVSGLGDLPAGCYLLRIRERESGQTRQLKLLRQ